MYFLSFFLSFPFFFLHRFVPLRPHARNRSPLPPHGRAADEGNRQRRSSALRRGPATTYDELDEQRSLAMSLTTAGSSSSSVVKLDERLDYASNQGFERPFGNQRVVSIACGNAHTLVATAVVEKVTGKGATRLKRKVGGDVYMAGAQSVLGKFCPVFIQCEPLADLIVDKVGRPIDLRASRLTVLSFTRDTAPSTTTNWRPNYHERT